MPAQLLSVPDVGAARVSARIAPHFTSLALIIGALRPGSTGLPDPWVERVRRDVPSMTVAELGMFRSRANYELTDFMVPMTVASDQPLAEAIDAIAATDEAKMRADLVAMYGDDVPDCWRPVMHEPRRWLSRYVGAERATARHTSTLWGAARNLLDREIARIGIAAVRGTLDVLLNTLSPDIGYADGAMSVRSRRAVERPDAPPPSAVAELGARPLVLVPMVCGHLFKLVNASSADAVWICYPLPGRQVLWSGGRPGPAPVSELAALVGSCRASILLQLTRPLTMGDLASYANVPPSGLSFHCKRLESAGLVARERSGRQVRITRTERGEQLVDLLAPFVI